MIGAVLELPACFAGQGNGLQIHFFGRRESAKDIRRIATGGDPAGAGQGFDLAGEDLVKTIAVCDGGDA